MKRQIACLGLALSLWTGLASPALAAGFADVPEGHWARDSVAYVTEKGLFQGAGPVALRHIGKAGGQGR